MLARQVILMMRDQPETGQSVLNLNVPDVAPDKLTRLQRHRVGTPAAAAVAVRQDPRGRPYYWIGGNTTPSATSLERMGTGPEDTRPRRRCVSIRPRRTRRGDVCQRPRAEVVSRRSAPGSWA